MTFNRIASLLALLAVVCVLAVFFCHSLQGPYSAVHGPVTALLSVRAATGVRLAIGNAASNIPYLPQLNFVTPLASSTFLAAMLTGLDHSSALVLPDLTLRC